LNYNAEGGTLDRDALRAIVEFLRDG